MFASLGRPDFFEVGDNLDGANVSVSGSSHVDPLTPFDWKWNMFGTDAQTISADMKFDTAKFDHHYGAQLKE